MKKIEFKINEMKCEGCAKEIRGAILKVDGVISSQVDFDSRIAKVEFDSDKTCENHIFKAIEAMNYKIVK